MKPFAVIAAFAAGTNALTTRGHHCCFTLTASGGTSGTVGQLDDGQNRIGGGLTLASYCIDEEGSITDSTGRGCFFTPPTSQFQCDTGATATSGFSVNGEGDLTYNGNSDFVACKAGDDHQFNIYTSPPSGDVSECVDVTLEADKKCASGSSSSSEAPPASSAPPSSKSQSVVVVTVTESACPAPTAPSSAPAQPSTPAQSPAPSSSVTACPAKLKNGSFEFPHLIIPIDSSSPDTAAGTSFNGEVSSTVSTIFNFNIPGSDSGKTCTLVFFLPEKKDLQTSSFSLSGDGKVDFAQLSSAATQSTSFSNAPSIEHYYGQFTLSPGNSLVIASFPCPAGQAVAFELEQAGTTDFKYFQDYNPPPIGLFITTC